MPLIFLWNGISIIIVELILSKIIYSVYLNTPWILFMVFLLHFKLFLTTNISKKGKFIIIHPNILLRSWIIIIWKFSSFHYICVIQVLLFSTNLNQILIFLKIYYLLHYSSIWSYFYQLVYLSNWLHVFSININLKLKLYSLYEK